MDLLGEAGFVSVVVAGAARAAAPLLSQQSVIAGVSDGMVRVPCSAPPRAAAPQGASAGAGRAGGAAPVSVGRGAAAAAVLQVCLLRCCMNMPNYACDVMTAPAELTSWINDGTVDMVAGPDLVTTACLMKVNSAL